MTDLALPERFKGRWRHALILTYNADIPFFERTLWSQLGGSCRNKIILADGSRFLSACADWARDGTVRHLNQLYVGDGIFVPQAAHAKLILLTNHEAGRLLVGSGNLSMNGYASGGESFSQYDFIDGESQSLAPFLTVREFLEELMARGYVSGVAATRINHLFENSPWLYRSAPEQWQPVRHNLHQSFLEQLQSIVGDEMVEEFWLHAPFHDPHSVALESLLRTLQPQKTFLLIQPGRTSLVPAALERVIGEHKKMLSIHSVQRKLSEGDPYIHAKFYIVKFRDRAICLHGSPNLSQVALLFTPPQGNIEVANLLLGSRDAFDGFLDGLRRNPYKQPLSELEIGPGDHEDESDELSSASWYLTSGEWSGQTLIVRFRGSTPAFQQLELFAGKQSVPFSNYRQSLGYITFSLLEAGVGRLASDSIVHVRWLERGEQCESNPIFICNHASLARALESVEGEGGLEAFGAIELEDEELEQLLAELNASFPIDRSSIWQLAGRNIPSSSTEDQEELHLDYSDINRDELRRHPKLQQYFHWETGTQTRYSVSRLQIVLNMITAHFRKLQTGSLGLEMIESLTEQMRESETETEEERESEEQEKQQRRQSSSARVRRLVHNFINRFLRGLRMSDFQEFVGYKVIVQNSIIFQHFLWRLFFKEWADSDFLIDSLLQVWVFLWGERLDARTGYLFDLTPEQRGQALDIVRQHHADAEMLAAVFHCSKLLSSEGSSEMRLQLRDFCREWLSHTQGIFSEQTIEGATHYLSEIYPYNTPRPDEIVKILENQCEYETESSFLRWVERQYGLPDHSCRFDWEVVYRPGNDRAKVRCLKIHAAQRPIAYRDTLNILELWMRFEKLDYYRANITTRDGEKTLIFMDTAINSGCFKNNQEGLIDLSQADFVGIETPWRYTIDSLHAVAAQVEVTLSMSATLSLIDKSA